MMNFYAEMKDDDLKIFHVEIEARMWKTALKGLKKVYPKARCVKLETRGGLYDMCLVWRGSRWWLMGSQSSLTLNLIKETLK